MNSTSDYAPRTMKWVFPLAALGLFITLAWSLLYQPPVPTTGAANAYSRSAIGYEALTESLDESGIRVIVSRWRSGKRGKPDVPVMVLEPLPEYDDELVELVEDTATRSTPILLGLSKWTAEEDTQGWVEIVELSSTDDALHGLDVITANITEVYLTRPATLTGWKGLPAGVVPELPYHPQVLVDYGMDLEPIVSTDQGVLIGKLKTVHGNDLYVVSDPDLWNTHGLNRPANAATMGWFISDHLSVDRLIIDEVVHGYEQAPNIWRELVSWPLNLFTMHLTLLMMLALAAAAGRMGRPLAPQPRIAPGLEGLLDNTARLLIHGGYTAHASRRYFRVTARDLAAKLSLPPGQTLEQQLDQLDALGRSERSGAAIWRAIHKLPERSGTNLRATRRAMTLAHATWTWREEMLNAR